MTESEMKTMKTGTTTVGLIFSEGVVLASDQKASMGHLAYDTETQKVFKITDTIGVTIAGSVGDALAILRFLKSKARLFEIERETKMTPKSAATLLSNVLNGTRYAPFIAQFVIGGMGETPELFDLDPAGGLLQRKQFAVTGSGTELAISTLDGNYKKDMTRDECIQIAVKAIQSAKRRDNYSGGLGVNLLVFTKDNCETVDIPDAEAFMK